MGNDTRQGVNTLDKTTFLHYTTSLLGIVPSLLDFLVYIDR